MYIVRFNGNTEVEEFYATNIEDLMLLLAEYTGNDRNYLEKAMNGFEKDNDKEHKYIQLFNDLFARYASGEVSAIYEIKDKWECNNE